MPLFRDLDPTEVLPRLCWCIDRRDWSAVRDLLADSVDVDYTSLRGGVPEPGTSGDALVEQWRSALDPLAATQHVVVPVLCDVDGDSARSLANVVGTHRRGAGHDAPSWVVAGHYDARLRRGPSGRWQVTALALVVAASAGDPSVMAPT